MTPQISPSSASAYRQCPKQYAYAASAALPIFSSDLHMGEALHATIQNILEYGQHKNRLPELDEVASIYQSKLSILPIQQNLPSHDEIAQMVDAGIPKLEVFLNQIAPKLQAMQQLELESWVRLYLHDQFGTVLVTGRIDMTFFDPAKNTYYVVDIKTGKTNRNSAQQNPQLALYTASIRYRVGNDARIRALTVYLNDGECQKIEYDQHNLERDLETLMVTARAAQNDKFFEMNRGFHCQWCNYQTACFADYPPEAVHVTTTVS